VYRYTYQDGSGGVNLNGCYVGVEVFEATMKILDEQIECVDQKPP